MGGVMAPERVTRAAAYAAFGVPMQVALPDRVDTLPAEPLKTVTAVPMPPPALEALPGSVEVGAVEARYRVAFRLEDVPGIRRRTVVVGPLVRGGESKRWRVDVVERVRLDEVWCLLVPEKDPTP